MRTAIIGSGIAGVTAAAELHAKGHDITVYEANNYVGGHVKTIRLPIEDDDSPGSEEVLPVELGVFMHDPKYIHPQMSSTAKKLGLKTREIPLTFSFVNKKYLSSWNTQSLFSGTLRDLSILLKTSIQSLKNGCFYQNTSFLLELKQFFKQMENVCSDKAYRNMSLEEFVKKEGYSQYFLDNWLLPQIMCWWGINRDHAMSSSIQVIVQSMDFVSKAPQYIFEGGWDLLIKKITEPFHQHIHTESPVEKVQRKNQKVEVTSKGKIESFDAVLFAVPPGVVLNLLQEKDSEEEKILKSFQMTTTRVYLHKDARWMPTKEKWSIVNLIHDERGSFCTLWFGGLDKRKPGIFVTWGDHLGDTPDTSTIITTADWLRTLPTVEYTEACSKIHTLQGRGGVWHCGAHVDALEANSKGAIPSLWHENSFRSGIEVSKMIEKVYIKRNK